MIVLTALTAFGSALLAFAQTTTSATMTTTTTGGRNLTQRLQNIVTRADQEINRRITALDNLASKISSMTKISDTEKSNLASSTEAQISEMNVLKAKVSTDSDLTSLKSDVQSIAKSYRIYMLIIPQGTITAAADRVMDVASSVQAIAVKLQSRISEDQSAGKDVTAIQPALSDLNAKVNDAETQAQAATSEVTGLTPDNGNTTQMQANTAALKDARTKIQTAMKDLQTARKDAGTIVQGLKALEGNVSPTTPQTTTPQS